MYFEKQCSKISKREKKRNDEDEKSKREGCTSQEFALCVDYSVISCFYFKKIENDGNSNQKLVKKAVLLVSLWTEV